MNRPAFQSYSFCLCDAELHCFQRKSPRLAEGGGFEPPVREPVRQFSKLLVSATHPSFLKDSGVRNRGVISLIAGAKVQLFFEPCKFLKDFFRFSSFFLPFLSGIRDSNPRPSAWEANALPTELIPLVSVLTSL